MGQSFRLFLQLQECRYLLVARRRGLTQGHTPILVRHIRIFPPPPPNPLHLLPVGCHHHLRVGQGAAWGGAGEEVRKADDDEGCKESGREEGGGRP